MVIVFLVLLSRTSRTAIYATDMLVDHLFFHAKEHGLTNLVIKDCHTRVHHSGLRASLAELRSRYWVLRARQIVKKLINKCVTFKKVGGMSYDTPPMASLPEFRVRESLVMVISPA